MIIGCENYLGSSNDTREIIDEFAQHFKPLRKFFNDYKDIHGWLTATLCLVGILLNLCNVVVLTRPRMVSTVNSILTAVAACDTGLMLSYLIYLSHFRIFKRSSDCDLFTSYNWAMFTLFHAHFSVVMRSLSLWLTVIMAIVRQKILKSHVPNPGLGSQLSIAYALICFTSAAVLIVNFPVYITFTIRVIRPSHPYNECTKPEYIVDLSPMALKHECLLTKVVFWTHALANKLIPSAVLCAFIFCLVSFIRDHLARRETSGYHVPQGMKPTTPILVVILTVSLLTEFPHVALSVISGIPPNGRMYAEHIYENLGDLLDLLSLLNCITTFILYCSMSKAFRDTFVDVITAPIARLCKNSRWLPVRLMSNAGLRRPLLGDTTTAQHCNGNNSTAITRCHATSERTRSNSATYPITSSQLLNNEFNNSPAIPKSLTHTF